MFTKHGCINVIFRTTYLVLIMLCNIQSGQKNKQNLKKKKSFLNTSNVLIMSTIHIFSDLKTI